MTNPIDRWMQLQTRRQFVGQAARGLGGVALASMLAREAQASSPGALQGGHFPGRAKRVIWLFMAGAPSQTSDSRRTPARSTGCGDPYS